MIFRHRVCSLVPMSRDALRSCDVDESIIADAMGFLRDRANRCQLLFRMYKAFVASGNVVIDFDPEDSAFLRALDNLNRVDRKSTRLNSSHSQISYAVFCLKKKI